MLVVYQYVSIRACNLLLVVCHLFAIFS